MLQGVEITDKDTAKCFLSFDLKDILPLAGVRAATSRWRCRFVECTGESAEELHAASDAGRIISGEELLRIASGLLQVIDGRFEAYSDVDAEPWLMVKAVDSSSFEVWSDDPDVIIRVRENFREVSDLPTDAA
jgi:hypothetical protein